MLPFIYQPHSDQFYFSVIPLMVQNSLIQLCINGISLRDIKIFNRELKTVNINCFASYNWWVITWKYFYGSSNKIIVLSIFNFFQWIWNGNTMIICYSDEFVYNNWNLFMMYWWVHEICLNNEKLKSMTFNWFL